MRYRWLVTLSALTLGAVVGDAVVGSWLIDRSLYKGRPLPPFGSESSSAHRVWLGEQQAALERGVAPGLLGGFDVELGWTNRPGVLSEEEGTGFNSLGARGLREYSPEPAPGVQRLACFGDSFTYCSEVAEDEAWPALLEAADETLEALNFGVGGYGTDQALLRFRRKAPDLSAQIVCIGIQLRSIGRNVNRYRPLFYPPTPNVVVKPRFILAEGRLQLLPLPLASREEFIAAAAAGDIRGLLAEHEYWTGDEPRISGSTIARFLAARPAYERRETWRLWVDPDSEPARVTFAILKAFHREALAAGAKNAVVLVFPNAEDLDAMHRRGVRYWKYLLDTLEDNDIPYVDFSETLGPAAIERDLYHVSHLNAEGNRMVAETLQGWLRENP